MQRTVLVVVGVLAGALAVPACENVSSDSIQRWKNTEKGPGKLQATIRDDKIPAKLRAEAAMALVQIGRADEVESALGGMSEPQREGVAAELVPLYISQLTQGSVNEGRDARDGLVGLRAKSSPAVQKQIDAALLPAIARELRAGRIAGGRHPLDRILMDMGPAASPTLLSILEEPAAPFPAVVEVLAKTGDPETRDKAGAALVRRAAKLPEIPTQLWRALGQIGGKSSIEYLENKVEKGHEQDAVLAAQALQQGPRSPGLVILAMKMAGNQRASKAVRDEMFGLLEHVASPEATEGAIRIIASDPEHLVRYRAYEVALSVGKADAVVRALEAFPAAMPHKPEDVKDFLVKDIEKLGAATGRPAALAALRSKVPLARMTGVQALESMGTAADAGEVGKLTGDRGTVKGFPGGKTVGKEAARVAGILQNKPGGGKP
jgi:HEAT repeat protein